MKGRGIIIERIYCNNNNNNREIKEQSNIDTPFEGWPPLADIYKNKNISDASQHEGYIPYCIYTSVLYILYIYIYRTVYIRLHRSE